jgi:hypothetical protein
MERLCFACCDGPEWADGLCLACVREYEAWLDEREEELSMPDPDPECDDE